ncbi:L-lysine 6-oxidase [Chitinophaga niastensis]|uniref:L-lysine 6-oxidase n=1 Tax=Chitinophaga niastensis TaxID=536980 RepID=A0A2P8HPV0_CHINA|nr:CTQ-dependent lysine 6-oxidase LodA [Chitinophaga niastensis]PSL48260.1 L-lysine 6-oxidase [Chitinophaga niastensis]
MKLSLHPSVGIARLGNSPDQICLSPHTIGGLPFNADAHGNQLAPITQFKDGAGLIKRQGQPFMVYNENGAELTLDTPNVKSITWTVHLANKKAAWYQYSELEGNLLYGYRNSYFYRQVPWRNPDVEGRGARQSLIIDPGPRTISGRQEKIAFTKDQAPAGYPVQYPPEQVKYGTPVTTLGDLLTDNEGRLIVLGGYGRAGGDEPLTSYGGSNTWHDDISDGTVKCIVSFEDNTPDVQLEAWVIVGSPDFAPEIVNISTLSDTMFDVGVRYFNLVPELRTGANWNENYVANFKRDILPIINRISRYQWVANVQSMMAFCSYQFDYGDPLEANRNNREQYFSYFRRPDGVPPLDPPEDQPQQKLWKHSGSDYFPMMPLNSGSNSVSEINIMKFLALDDTQYFLMKQWAKGKFENTPEPAPGPIHPMDAASVGNCVGLPMCPGIEVTWNMQNRLIYKAPYIILQRPADYYKTGLSPDEDECLGNGCEPGDLTKRMACPWQADFFQCTVQYINFTNPTVNKVNKQPLPPTYYSYWWPPQSPWDVLTGQITEEGQAAAHAPAGLQVNYQRGINSFVQMVEHWSALGFIRDQHAGEKGFPYLVETERVNELFTYKDVPVGDISGNKSDDETTIPVYFIQEDKQAVKKMSARGAALVEHLETLAFKPIAVAAEGLPMPRSGSRNRF